jgi:DHA1 family bicyclomycin/chloramphenicol resistance-like MFS transporter
VAGSASALLGTIQFVLASVTGALVSAFTNGTPVPLAAVIAGCGVAAFVSHLVGGRRSTASPLAGSPA